MEEISIQANTLKSRMFARESRLCAGSKILARDSQSKKFTMLNNPSYDPVRHISFREASGLRPGGYGVLLAKHLVDELMYSEKGNEVLLVKYLRASAGATQTL